MLGFPQLTQSSCWNDYNAWVSPGQWGTDWWYLLLFLFTGDRTNFQGRCIIRHPYTGEMNCSAASQYQQRVATKQEQEAQNLANLTGWDIDDIRDKITFVEAKPVKWWRNLWN